MRGRGREEAEGQASKAEGVGIGFQAARIELKFLAARQCGTERDPSTSHDVHFVGVMLRSG
jgi:predicted alpha/beta-hydrolase family hydrolase